MNPLNYASLEASKRLYEAGIVLETDMVFEKHTWLCSQGSASKWVLILRSFAGRESKILPAPSMAEVWRELPETTEHDGITYYIAMEKEDGGITECWVRDDIVFSNTNPTDALIDLLIWVRRGNDA
jgi:hypothetical protein